MAQKKNSIEKLKCSTCGREFEKTNFGISFSFKNKDTGRLSMCKSCCADLFDRLMLQYQDETKALYRFCMMLDLYFSRDTVNKLLTRYKNSDNNLGLLYLSKMGLVQYKNKTFEDDMNFINIFSLSEAEIEEMKYLNVEKNKEEILKQTKQQITPEIIQRWGADLTPEEYMFLEDRYMTMVNSYDDKNPTSLWGYQEIAMNYLLLRKERGNYTAQKNIQETISKLQGDCKMKLSQIDSGDDDSACFGGYIDKIENYEPCDKRLPFFDDIDNIKKYIKKWFVQPFAREMNVAVEKVQDGEMVDDYQDLSQVFADKEQDKGKYDIQTEVDVEEEDNVNNNEE